MENLYRQPLGGLGANVGGKDWEEKMKMRIKMKQYGKLNNDYNKKVYSKRENNTSPGGLSSGVGANMAKSDNQSIDNKSI